MRSTTKWISGFLLGMLISPACHRAAEPARAGSPMMHDDAGTELEQPSDRPGIQPDTGAPIGPVANPRPSQYEDGLLAAPIGGTAGTGAAAGMGGMGAVGAGGSGGTGLVSAPRYVVAL